MKTRLIHGGLYRETMRRLRLPSLVILILTFAVECVPQLVEIMLTYSYIFPTIDDFFEVHYLQYTYPFVVPLLLTLMAFHFHTSRTDSDFYHALPFTRASLATSILAAVATWCAIITVGSAAMVGLTLLPFPLGFTVWNILLNTGASFLASMLMLSLTFLTVTMCGNLISMVFAVCILLFSPLLIASSLISALVDTMPILAYQDTFAQFIKYNLMYGGYDTASAWIGTAVGTAVCFALAFWMNTRRPSETAGNATAHPALQITLRLLLSLVCCLPAIQMALSDYFDLVSIVMLYVLALVAYFLYELFTTKKVKNLLKAIPWLGVLAMLNVFCILGITYGQQYVLSIQPNALDVEWVSLTKISTFTPLSEYGTADVELYDSRDIPTATSDNTDGLATETPVLPTRYGDFETYCTRYEKSACPKVRLTDHDAKIIITNRLKEACQAVRYDDYYKAKFHGGLNKEWCYYDVEVAVHVNGVTHKRVLWLYDSELALLFAAIDEQEHVPPLYDHFQTTYPKF